MVKCNNFNESEVSSEAHLMNTFLFEYTVNILNRLFHGSPFPWFSKHTVLTESHSLMSDETLSND